MKLRIEPDGAHFYDRMSGTHILLDEIDTSKINKSIGPRTVSISITNKCNLNCRYCFIKKGCELLDRDYILQLSEKFDGLDTFDIAIGGGEPFLHPELIEICRKIWVNTSLGVSITTNGTVFNEDTLKALKGYVSIIRISIDGIGDVYEFNRNFNFDKILNSIAITSQHHRVGLNVIVQENTISHLDAIGEIYKKYDCCELLLLPVIDNGKVLLSDDIKIELENWILKNSRTINLRLLSSAKELIDADYLFESILWENSYLYIDVYKNIRQSSYGSFGLKIDDLDKLEDNIRIILA